MDETIKEGVYFGVDIGADATLVSYFEPHMDEPVTISTVMGSESYQIPTYLAKKKGVGQWFFGNDAKNQVQLAMATGVDDLYGKALRNETVFVETEQYQARELLFIFFRKLLSLPGYMYANAPLAKLVICVEHLDLNVMEMFTMTANKLGIEPGRLMVIDRRESFYYYALNQDPNLFFGDVMLFDYSGSELLHCRLHRNTSTTPQLVDLSEGNDGSLMEEKDRQFDGIIKRLFTGNAISSVYLTGNGFDGDWMKVSLANLLRGRRVFLGKNLYSKGACYAGAIRDKRMDWPFVYIGDNELKLNVSLKVLDCNEMKFLTLITAGESWYESKGECEVVLDGTPEIECWVQRPESRQAAVEVLNLEGLPARENRTTRLRISAKPTSDKEVEITIRDLGFGEIVPATNRVFVHQVRVD